MLAFIAMYFMVHINLCTCSSVVNNAVPCRSVASEADPVVSWHVSRCWQADATYAAMAVKVRNSLLTDDHQSGHIFDIRPSFCVSHVTLNLAEPSVVKS